MFSFFSSDEFIIALEVVFLLFIAYDAKRYFETRKREYIFNIVLTFGFFIYAAIPFYNKYYTWSDKAQQKLLSECLIENNTSVCECLDDMIVKEYNFSSYQELNKLDLTSFVNETKKECLEDME
ncbi:MAG: hypothetical protein GQ570_08910 [Helicobacteraceae bacterium]|nr:hypothetical protein [Helicobacteraceae bacterium]